jgi:hypothetical protein
MPAIASGVAPLIPPVKASLNLPTRLPHETCAWLDNAVMRQVERSLADSEQDMPASTPAMPTGLQEIP